MPYHAFARSIQCSPSISQKLSAYQAIKPSRLPSQRGGSDTSVFPIEGVRAGREIGTEATEPPQPELVIRINTRAHLKFLNLMAIRNVFAAPYARTLRLVVTMIFLAVPQANVSRLTAYLT
jgi:hypothetical protein